MVVDCRVISQPTHESAVLFLDRPFCWAKVGKEKLIANPTRAKQSAFSIISSPGCRVICRRGSRCGFCRVAGGKRINAFGRRSLGDTPIGRLADSAVNEKRFCIGFALVFVPLAMKSPTTPAENPKVLVHRAIAPFFGVGRIVDDRYPARGTFIRPAQEQRPFLGLNSLAEVFGLLWPIPG